MSENIIVSPEVERILNLINVSKERDKIEKDLRRGGDEIRIKKLLSSRLKRVKIK